MCTPLAVGAGCNDGDLCTTMDACGAGACVGTAVTCVADECHEAGICNSATGLCDNPAKPDGTSCGADSICKAGTCTMMGAGGVGGAGGNAGAGGSGASGEGGTGGNPVIGGTQSSFSCSIPGNDPPSRDVGGSFLALMGVWLVRRRRNGRAEVTF